MKVKLNVQKATARGPHGAGCTVTVDDATAKMWIAAGEAEKAWGQWPTQGATKVHAPTKKNKGGRKR